MGSKLQMHFCFSDVFRSIERDQCYEMGLKNQVHFLIYDVFRGYRKRSVAQNGLEKQVQKFITYTETLCHYLHQVISDFILKL